MTDSECCTGGYNYFKFSIGAEMKNTVMMKLVSDKKKKKNMSNDSAKKPPFKIRYVPDEYNTKQMCNESILENEGIIRVSSSSA